MKKQVFALALALAFLSVAASAAQPDQAYASTQNVEVNGRAVEFQMYALKDANGYDTNYVKLRDVAYVLNGTTAQFDVGWDGAVNIENHRAYMADGSEMYTPYSGNRRYSRPSAITNIDGAAYDFDAILLQDDSGGGYTYYKLRDLGEALGFTVDWSDQRGIYIETPAEQEEPTQDPPEEAPTDAPAEEEEEESPPEPVPFENNAYIVLSLDTVTSWEDACAYCAQQGGHLATIDSQEENDYIRGLLADAEADSAFLGFSKEGGEWVWYNGLSPLYTNWAGGQPGSGAHAAISSANGQWSARSFPSGAFFICEWDN